MALLSIDLGTSSAKAVVIDDGGHLLGVGMHEYPIRTPKANWAEQPPSDWWAAGVAAARGALAAVQHPQPIAAIGLSGQMHGFALVDANGAALGDAIIWPDQRSAQEVAEIRARIGAATLAHTAGTAPATGFMAPTLLWLLRHDPARLERGAACLLPKDYLRYRMVGTFGAEASDASATALFDVQKRQWSSAIVSALGLPERLLPPVLESGQIVGELLPSAAAELGLPAGIPVVAGCADQVAQAVGNDLLEPGDGSVTLGSGGQVFIPLSMPLTDPQLRLHTFCHAPTDRWYLLGAMLTAGLSLRWLRDTFALTAPDAYEQLSAEAAQVPAGSDGLFFLPYLAGERSPLMDSQARGCFIGLTLRHGRGHMARAIMEGVAFALRQILETMLETGAPVGRILAAGNGLASPVWRGIVCDVLNRPLDLRPGRERTATGAALVAGVGIGLYPSFAAAAKTVALPAVTSEPNAARAAFYAERFARFVQLYPLLKDTFEG